MQQAQTEDPCSKLVHGIRAIPDPATVVADDCQHKLLLYLELRILTIDPSFSLGEFDITHVTYA